MTDIKRQVRELQLQVSTLEQEKAQMATELSATLQDVNQKALKIDELVAEEKRLAESINEIDNAFKSHRCFVMTFK